MISQPSSFGNQINNNVQGKGENNLKMGLICQFSTEFHFLFLKSYFGFNYKSILLVQVSEKKKEKASIASVKVSLSSNFASR